MRVSEMKEGETGIRRWIIWNPGNRLVQIARWLASSVSKDEGRPALTVIARHGEALVACDGYKMHAIQAPPEWPEARYIRPKFIPANGNGPLILEEDPDVSGYPDFSGIYPTREKAVATIGINPVFLRDALNEFIAGQGRTGRYGGPPAVVLRIYGEMPTAMPIELLSANDEGPYVLVMPMHIGGPRGEPPEGFWRPKYQKKEEHADAAPATEAAVEAGEAPTETKEESDLDSVPNASGVETTGD